MTTQTHDVQRERIPHWMDNRKIDWVSGAPFVAVHLAALYGILFVPATASALALGFGLYVLRMWGITAGYHRYFAHRTYKTGRVFQFVLAFIAMMSAQRGALWWAAHHRRHHLYSDQPGDIHSPRREGFWYSHMGWIFVRGADETDWDRIRDFAQYPELRFFDRFFLVPPTLLAVACLWLGGSSALFWGFFASTVFTWHVTFFINSLTHVWGWRRFKTTDDSRNNLVLALLTLGEGWHNNHHRYQNAARNGFYWGEIDVTYGVLKVLEKLGVVSDLKPVPARILEEGRGVRLTGNSVLEPRMREAEVVPTVSEERLADPHEESGEHPALPSQMRDAG